MDPQTQAFTPYSNNGGNETWRLQADVGRLAQVQSEHADRIARLERRQEDDARMKSVWGQSSPFPSVLSGTPQQAPLHQPPGDQFRNFDGETNHLMGSLHLDAEEEPRRGMGATSRANSVRFDETANQNHFSHSSRNSVDFLSRSNSGLGGLPMAERSSSHKSDGRASSVHSMRSAASGRANSLSLDTAYGLGESNRSPLGTPGLAPGLMLLGSVPAIIRCWMNMNFKHDALLYAAVCTGSVRSFLDLRLIHKLGFEGDIKTASDGARTVELSVFFPEAVPHPASSRSSSPAPQLPTLTVEFQVVEHATEENDKAIQIFLGSDTLRAHSADILLSSNRMTIFDDERSKLSIPLVRPESEAAFRNLYVASATGLSAPEKMPARAPDQPYFNGLGRGSSGVSLSSAAASPPPGKYQPPGAASTEAAPLESAKPGAIGSEHFSRPTSGQSNASRPSMNLASLRPTDLHDSTADNTTAQAGTPSRSSSGAAIWNNWRRDGTSAAAGAPPANSSQPSSAATLDWAGASKNRETAYQRKDTGIKVLKPKTANRTFSGSSSAAPGGGVGMGSMGIGGATVAGPGTASPADGRSKFFDEGRRRGSVQQDGRKENHQPGSASGGAAGAGAGAGGQAPFKTKSNPIGGASAFSWMNK